VCKASCTCGRSAFKLSQLEPILKDTPIVDPDQTEVDASMDLRYEKSVLSAAGGFQMAHLSLFAPRLVAEPVRDLSVRCARQGAGRPQGAQGQARSS
jgi:hypothetical protein